ncbi:hypothetical protein N7472_005767 [Penicillium cf. griseofulvum]|uniref:Uncharacterized protein n=1 Tax=Penicillium cf. griseofulvum TaxID=2972120 RepID=A0A9W9JP58_9EURO|nr:hypothetical protein N7472_005767 [Penicillium cf. griseofulvum]
MGGRQSGAAKSGLPSWGRQYGVDKMGRAAEIQGITVLLLYVMQHMMPKRLKSYVVGHPMWGRINSER